MNALCSVFESAETTRNSELVLVHLENLRHHSHFLRAKNWLETEEYVEYNNALSTTFSAWRRDAARVPP